MTRRGVRGWKSGSGVAVLLLVGRDFFRTGLVGVRVILRRLEAVPVFVALRVQLDVVVEHVRDRVVLEDGFPRTCRLTGAAIDAFVGRNVEHIGIVAAGRLIEAELEVERGRYLYELELLDEQGRLWKLYFDAKTGQQVKLKRKR